MVGGLSFRATAACVLAYGLAMAYLESAVVVYLQAALGINVGNLFPLQPAQAVGVLAAIEVGREVATLVMIGSVGMLAGRSWLERLAWVAVIFGSWDIAYYGWLYVFSGWPPNLSTVDLLFLLPVPWAGPVWSPVAVSCALVGFGLAAAWSDRSGAARAVAEPGASRWTVARREMLAGVAGGLLVVGSYTVDASRLIAGGLPGPYPWPLFAAGIALATAGGFRALWRARRAAF